MLDAPLMFAYCGNILSCHCGIYVGRARTAPQRLQSARRQIPILEREEAILGNMHVVQTGGFHGSRALIEALPAIDNERAVWYSRPKLQVQQRVCGAGQT